MNYDQEQQSMMQLEKSMFSLEYLMSRNGLILMVILIIFAYLMYHYWYKKADGHHE